MGKLLVGYDGSEGARKAVDRALSMMKEGDEIVLIFVVPHTKLEEFAGFDPGVTEDKAREELKKVTGPLLEQGVSITGIVKKGSVADEIIRLGSELECDLIVVGSYGLSKVGTFALGNVAEAVAKKSTRPVLLVR